VVATAVDHAGAPDDHALDLSTARMAPETLVPRVKPVEVWVKALERVASSAGTCVPSISICSVYLTDHAHVCQP